MTNLKMKKPILRKKMSPFFMMLVFILIMSAISLIAFWFFSSVGKFDSQGFISGLLIGAFAQVIDGALGMAYGVVATTFLLSQGITPAVASGSVHIAEIFTTGASGLSHWRFGNINKKLFLNLVFPGIVGGLIGVYFVTNIDGEILRPWISAYLLILGIRIIFKAFRKIDFHSLIKTKKIAPLALFGGFVDAVGGGGWGPVVTSTLLGSGHEPKRTIGSVNSAEFFVTCATGFSFAVLIGVSYWEIVAGLIVGGLLFAPLAAKIISKIPAKYLIVTIGSLIVALSLINIYKFLN